ncbi:MAG: hypothetical protein ACI8XB_002916 [Patiriisocius sp.]|jgi:hypothetical protein
MKRILPLFLFAFIGNVYAQTDALNLDKYWKFRNNFVEKYVKIGVNFGESIPAGKRKPCSCIEINYL